MATKTVFTIGRQFGSGGRIIGKMLAKQLGIPFYDKELLTEAAKESGISEELFESLDEKPASNFLYAMVMGNYAYSQAGTGAGMTINDRLVQAQTKAIEDIASKGGAVGNYEKQPRCMMKTCAWDDENERFHPVLRELIPFYKEKMEKAEEKFLAMKKIYTTLLGMFADEMKQEELEKDECYGCAYGKCGPCIGICYKSMKA